MDLSWSLEKICFATRQRAACSLEVNVSNSEEDMQLGAELANLHSWGGEKPRLLCPWNCPGETTGVGTESLLQRRKGKDKLGV